MSGMWMEILYLMYATNYISIFISIQTDPLHLAILIVQTKALIWNTLAANELVSIVSAPDEDQ